MRKQLFAIMSPTMGKREDVPSILLAKAFTVDNENSCLRYGEIHRAKMRLKELLSSLAETTVDVESAVDQAVLSVTATTDFLAGGTVLVDEGETHEATYVILSVQADVSLTMTTNLLFTHEVAETVEQAALNKTITPDGNSILQYHLFTKRSTGTEYLLSFTKKHIYLWTSSGWQQKFECSSDCENWVVVSYNDKVIATNNVDKVLIWDVIPANNFIFLDDSTNGVEYSAGVYLTKAKYLITFENYLILGYTTENGVVYPQRIRWSDLGNGEVTGKWKTGDASSLEVGKGDFLKGFGLYDNYFIVFKAESHYKIWLVPTSETFIIEAISNEIGTISNGSIVNDKFGMLYYIASDYTIRKITGKEVSFAIDPTIKTISPAYAHLIRSTFIDEYGQIMWAVPHSSTTNNKVLVLKDDKWGQLDLAISAFGNYKKQSIYTWNTLAFSTWDSWGWDKWDIQEAEVGFEIELGADYSGYTYALFANEKDDTANYSGYFVLSTDLSNKRGLAYYKRISDLKLYVRKETTGTLTIEIKRDYETDWQSAGTIDLTGDEDILVVHLPVDFRAKHFLIKISAENRFRFIGIMFKFVLAGER